MSIQITNAKQAGDEAAPKSRTSEENHANASGLAPISAPPVTESETSVARRACGLLIVVAAFVMLLTVNGLPTDPLQIFLWIVAVEIAWNSHLSWRTHLGFLRDWVGIVILLVVYNFSRGFADDLIPVHITAMIHADTALAGWATGGEVPSVWLQNHLYDPLHTHWYDVAISVVYFSHFVAAPIVAAVLWFRNRTVWLSFVRRWFTLFALGLVTYFVYPAMPPWLASANGYLPPVEHGVATRGWYAIGMAHGGNLLTEAQINSANLIAAMPSLHSAFSLFICVFFMQRVSRRWWPLLLAYPLAMAFTLMYSGEHYLIDVLVGWAFTGATFVLVHLVESWSSRRAEVPAAACAVPADDAVLVSD